MKKLELDIDVTAEDIAAGVKGNCGHCPLALAFRRAIAEKFCNCAISYCAVEGGELIFSMGPQLFTNNRPLSFRAKHSEETSVFVSRFDQGLSVQPNEFKLIFT